jgi:hypothetical protein
MSRQWKDRISLCSFAAVLIGLTVAIIVSADTPTAVDPLLSIAQAAGFPAWAGVVAWGVLKVTGELKSISTKLDDHILDNERRLARIEAKTELDSGFPFAHSTPMHAPAVKQITTKEQV